MEYFLILLLVLLTSCTNSSNIDKQSLVYCSEGSPVSFNPQLAVDTTTYDATGQTIYNRLIAFKPGTTEIEPSLAKSWTISEDGLTYTFYLRPNVQFHTTRFFKPTRAFNADDVVFSFNRQRDPKNIYHLVGGGNYQFFKSLEMDKVVSNVIKLDDLTVQFELARRDATFLANLAIDFASILSKEYADQLLIISKPENIDTVPIGTGPFVFLEYVKDTTIKYSSHPNYFKGEPKIKKLIFSITPDSNVQFQKLKKGECDVIARPSPQDLPQIKKDNKLKLVEIEGMNIGYLAFNTEKFPFNNPVVRRAIAHALDKSTYLNAVYLGTATAIDGPLPPSIWGNYSAIKKYDYNVETAKKLIKEAGFKNGFDTELWTLPTSRIYNPDGKKMGELIQADLAKIGIKVKLLTYDWPTFLDKTKKGEHYMAELGWAGDTSDPDGFLGKLLNCAGIAAGTNRTRWCNKEYSDLVVKAKESADNKSRLEYYAKAQQIFANELPWIPIASARIFKAMNSKVEGYISYPQGISSFQNVSKH